jgi:hypothetical protein
VKVLSAFPKIMVLEGGAARIRQTVAFMSSDAELEEAEVTVCLERFPSLFGTQITDMKRVIAFLHEHEVVTAGDGSLPKVIKAFPYLLTLRVPAMTRVVNYLKKIGVNNVGRFISRVPPLLSHNVEREIMPKWTLLKEQGVEVYTLSRFPAYFSYPLSRINDRYSYLNSLDMQVKSLGIDKVLRGGDEDFVRTVAGGGDVADYHAFLRSNKPGKD